MPFISDANPSERNDVDVMVGGDRFPVVAGPELRASKWRGGLWVMYVTSTEGDYVVEVSDGNEVAGFLMFPSERYYPIPLVGGSDVGSNANFTSGQPATGVGGQNVVTMVSGGARTFFKMYETVALAGGTRSGGAITYSVNEALKISENGLLCNDSDVQLGLAGVTTPVVVGIVSAVPSSRNGNRLGADVKY